MALDRTWYNALRNDTGTGLDGSIWAKEDVDALMDAVDLELARIDLALADPTIARTNRQNIFTVPQSIKHWLTIEPAPGDIAARQVFYDTTQPTNQRAWQLHAHAQNFRIWPLNDDGTSFGAPAFILNRLGDCHVPGSVRSKWFAEGLQPYAVNYFIPYVPQVSSPEGVNFPVVRSECGFSKSGQLVTMRLHLQGVLPSVAAGHLRISQSPLAGGSGWPTWDQQMCRIHIVGGGGDEVGYMMANGGWIEVHRLNEQPFPANASTFVIGTPIYWTAQT